jgi:hypothetical protein
VRLGEFQQFGAALQVSAPVMAAISTSRLEISGRAIEVPSKYWPS